MKTRILLFTLVAFSASLLRGAAQGTAFTYQGRLDSGGAPFTGNAEFQATLWSAVSGGTQVAANNRAAVTVPVTNGLFVLPLEFGANFPGADRWLQLEVCTSPGPFTTLSPRQRLTPTPYAIRALSAASVPAGAISSAMLADGAVTAAKIQPGAVSQLGTPDGVVSNVVQVTNAGIIGPGARLLFQVQDETDGYFELNGALSLAVSGNLLAVAAEVDNAVTLLDVTNPQLPVIRAELRDGVSGFTNLNQAWSVAMKSNLLAVAALSDDTVTLVDVANPSLPVKLAEMRDGVAGWNELNGATAVAISGEIMAIGAFIDSAVTLADISNPSAPVLRSVMKDGVGVFTNLLNVRSVALAGNLLAIGAQGDNAVTLVDVSNPASPVKRAELRDGVGGFNYLQGAWHVALSGGLLAIAAESAVTLVSVSNPASPVKLAEIKDDTNGVESLAGVQAVAFSGHWLAAAASVDQAVTLFDISEPSSPVVLAVAQDGLGGFDFLDGASAVAFIGTNLAAAARFDDSLTLWSYGQMVLAPAVVMEGNVVVESAELFDVNAVRVALGADTTASGPFSFAGGYRAVARHRGAFVWADTRPTDFASTADDQFSVRAGGGVRFTDGGLRTISWVPGAAGWTSSSDRNLKEGVKPLDTRAVLEKVSRLPVAEWNFKGHSQRHIGPMAQDFHAQFPLNTNDTMIDSGDLHGVALAAIQGLNQKLTEELKQKATEITELKQRLEALEKIIRSQKSK